MDSPGSQSAGKGLPAKYRGNGPAAVGGHKANLYGNVKKIGYEIYMDELNQCVLTPVPKPTQPVTGRHSATQSHQRVVTR